MEISYKLDEKEKKIIERAETLTCYDYKRKDDLIPADSFIDIIEDLIIEIDHIQEELDDFKQDVNDNYEPITIKEQISYNEKW